jgi:multiple sugar transport system permease protein
MRARSLLIGLGKTLAVTAILLWSLVPIAFIMISSFKPERDIFATPPTFTFGPTLQHYSDLWAKWGTFFDGLLNSLIITALATAVAIVASAMAGFAYSRRRSRAMAGSAISLIAVRLIPPVVLTLPLFPIVNALKINDTHFILIILYATFFVSMGTLLMRTFIDQIPQ